jgi:hypothetical protein
MGAEQSPSRARRAGRCLVPLAVAGACLLALACFARKPSSDGAPSAAPEAPPPAAEVQTAPPAPAAEPLEEKRETPTLGEDGRERSRGTGAAAPAPAPLVPQKQPATKARRSAQPEADMEHDDRAPGASESSSDRLRQRLDRAYRAGAPDCPAARDRKKAVCDLAAQICQLIDRDPNVAAVAEYCADAKERCAEAQRRTEERCPE